MLPAVAVGSGNILIYVEREQSFASKIFQVGVMGLARWAWQNADS